MLFLCFLWVLLEKNARFKVMDLLCKVHPYDSMREKLLRNELIPFYVMNNVKKGVERFFDLDSSL